MAIAGNVKETNSGSTSNYVKTYGLMEYEILGVNLSYKKLKELGFYVKEGDEDKEREFTSEREGVRRADIEFACKAKDGKLRKFKFTIDEVNARNSEEKERALWLYINDQAMSAWSEKPNTFVGITKTTTYFTGVDDAYNPRPALVGEVPFMTFMRNCMRINYREGGTIKYNLKKFFNGNFKELQDDLQTDFLGTIVVATTIATRKTDEGNKQIESFYKFLFAPGDSFKVVQEKKVFSQEYIDEIKGKNERNKTTAGKKQYLSPIDKLILNMVDEKYGCEDAYHLGLPIEFVASNHVETSPSAIVAEDNDDTSLY
jgi:hypothetical protein